MVLVVVIGRVQECEGAAVEVVLLLCIIGRAYRLRVPIDVLMRSERLSKGGSKITADPPGSGSTRLQR